MIELADLSSIDWIKIVKVHNMVVYVSIRLFKYVRNLKIIIFKLQNKTAPVFYFLQISVGPTGTVFALKHTFE